MKQRKNFGIFSFFTGAGFIDLFARCGGLSLGMEHANEIRGINWKTLVNRKKDGSK